MLRRRLTKVEVMVLIGAVVGVALVFFGRSRPPERPFRGAMCAANLVEISRGLHIYAASNQKLFPIANHALAKEPGVGQVRYAPRKIGVHRGGGKDPSAGETTNQDTQMSTTRNLWVLIRLDMLRSAESFICPFTQDKADNEIDPKTLRDFRGYSAVSYGYQVPYGKRGRPSTDLDPGMAVAADKGPFGAALEAGARSPGSSMPDDLKSAKAWRPWNSPSHNRQGQNVMYMDGNIRYRETPLAGVKSDNIYTRWQTPDGGTDALPGPRIHGTPPTGIETPFSDTDSLIYP